MKFPLEYTTTSGLYSSSVNLNIPLELGRDSLISTDEVSVFINLYDCFALQELSIYKAIFNFKSKLTCLKTEQVFRTWAEALALLKFDAFEL